MSCDNCINMDAPERCAAAGCEEPEAFFNRKINLLAILAGAFLVLWVVGSVYGVAFRANHPGGSVLDHYYAKPYPVVGE